MATQIKRNGTQQIARPTRAFLFGVLAQERQAEAEEREAAESARAAHDWEFYSLPAYMRGCECSQCEQARAELAAAGEFSG